MRQRSRLPAAVDVKRRYEFIHDDVTLWRSPSGQHVHGIGGHAEADQSWDGGSQYPYGRSDMSSWSTSRAPRANGRSGAHGKLVVGPIAGELAADVG
jgi:hypothetical protein